MESGARTPSVFKPPFGVNTSLLLRSLEGERKGEEIGVWHGRRIMEEPVNVRL